MSDSNDLSRFSNSIAQRKAASRHLAGGVSSTPRGSQLPVPLVIERAEGAHIFDADGNEYVDFALGYGPLILGHTPKPVIEAVERELAKGLRTASVHRGEGELADLMAETVPAAKVVTFVSTGTEAVQLALRIARAATGRVPVVKFRANYHGWADSLHVASGPGSDGPSTAGQDPQASASVTILDWGDIDAVERTLTSDHAAVILEPAAINGGCFAPPAGYLERLRELTARLGVMLIFDEVITGFRLAPGGAQEIYGVTPDLVILGKALGAGLPISAVAGSPEAMEPVTSGRVMHRGTFNGNPLSLAAGIACLGYIRSHAGSLYPRMNAFAERLQGETIRMARAAGVPVTANRVGSAVQIFVGAESIDGISDLKLVDRDATLRFTGEMVRAGVQPLPRGLVYLCSEHDERDIERALAACETAISALKSGR